MEINDMNSALKAFNALADARDALRVKYDERDRKLRAALETVELFLLEEMKRLNLNEFGVPGEGVAHMQVKRRFGAADWSVVWDWVIQNKCPHMLQKRLLDSEIQTYLDTTGSLPPGINSEAKRIVKVLQRPPK